MIISCNTLKTKTNNFSKNIDNQITIVQISDLHFNPGNKIYFEMVERINEINPDLLFITGDMVDKNENVESLGGLLSNISIKGKTYAILGNWEYWGNINLIRLKEVLQLNNIELLINQQSSITVYNRKINIFGMDSLLGGNPSIRNLSFVEENLNIILAHEPIIFQNIANSIKNDFDIFVFSGHTHAGQITFFGLPIILPPGSGKYSSGIYSIDNFHLNVNKGIGFSKINIRLFAAPTIDVFVF